ncbi:MAG TPA: ribosome biogenesis GTP-binding protein YihA/YsxC [Sandaracinaceae bacterium LLY-WYZ-13_1]|nr:ribosome biogenesis GTP-binding protein YihA/YsxC [Sandaracinaceae bacterium LLY-WYZ-13_1]
MEVLDARFVASATRQDALPAPAFAEVAFAGRSNVGKSSLINELLGRRKLVRTSSTPGCTRGLSLFRARLRPRPGEEAYLDLVDLPGYGYAKRSKAERRSWGPMIEGFLEQRVGLRAVVVIVDVRRGPEEDDEGLLEYLAHLGIPAIVVATKLDKLPANKRKPALAKLRPRLGQRPVGFSAVTGEGAELLWARILKAASIGAGDQSA